MGFQWRQGLGGLVGWGLALVATGLVIGGITSAFTAYVAENPDVQEFVGSLRLRRPRHRGWLRRVDGRVRGDGGRAVRRDGHQPSLGGRAGTPAGARLPRSGHAPEWLGASVVSTVSAALVVSAGCAMATWTAVQAANGDLGLADAALGLVNTLPAVAVFLGTAVLLLGVKPEVTRLGAGGFVIVALFISVFGPTVKLPSWALDFSPFHHLAPVPAKPVAWGATTVLLVLAAVLSLAGFLAYRRRDLRG